MLCTGTSRANDIPEHNALAVRSRSSGRTSEPKRAMRRALQMQPRRRQWPTPPPPLQGRRMRAVGLAQLQAVSRRPEQWSSIPSVSAQQTAGMMARSCMSTQS